MTKIKVNNKKFKKGFTLIELMIVMSIILILLSIMVPKFSGYQKKAKKVKVVNTAKQIYQAAILSYGEQDGAFDNAKIIDTVNEITGLGISESDIKANDGDVLGIHFMSDKKDYRVTAHASQNYFVVTDAKQSTVYSSLNP